MNMKYDNRNVLKSHTVNPVLSDHPFTTGKLLCTGGCILLNESSAESSFHTPISNHLPKKVKNMFGLYGRLTQV